MRFLLLFSALAILSVGCKPTAPSRVTYNGVDLEFYKTVNTKSSVTMWMLGSNPSDGQHYQEQQLTIMVSKRHTGEELNKWYDIELAAAKRTKVRWFTSEGTTSCRVFRDAGLWGGVTTCKDTKEGGRCLTYEERATSVSEQCPQIDRKCEARFSPDWCSQYAQGHQDALEKIATQLDM